MTIALITIGGALGTVALAAFLIFGIGPVAALLLIWIGGLAATVGLAVSVVSTTVLSATQEDIQRTASGGSDAS